MSDETHVKKGPTLDPLQLFKRGLTLARRSLRFWPVFVGAALLAAVAVLLTPKVLPPVYTSQSTLMYREIIQTTSLVGRDDVPVESQRQRGTRLKEMLTSRTNLEAIINELGVYQDTVESLGALEAVEEFRKDTKVVVGEDSFSITYESDDPKKAHAVTKRLAESLQEQSAKYRLDQATSTMEFIAQQADRTKAELDQREHALAEFLSLHPEFAMDMMMPGQSTAGASIRAHERERTGKATAPKLLAGPENRVVSALERQRARLMARLDDADKPPAQVVQERKIEIDPAMQEDINRARRDVERAQSEVTTARGKYTDMHPDVQAAQRRLAQAQATLAAAQAAAKASLAQQDSGMPAQVAAQPVDKDKLRQQLSLIEISLRRAGEKEDTAAPVVVDEKTQKSSNWIVDLETEWASLNRDVQDTRDRNQQIQHRLFQASILAKVEASSGAEQMAVIDPAFEPLRPNRRGPRRTGAAAALVVFLLGAIFAFVLAYFDDRIYDEHDLRELSLGSLSHVVPARKR
jgi:capsular polysaccharide biosynthesis protein